MRLRWHNNAYGPTRRSDEAIASDRTYRTANARTTKTA
jgi:hypothetical protein